MGPVCDCEYGTNGNLFSGTYGYFTALFLQQSHMEFLRRKKKSTGFFVEACRFLSLAQCGKNAFLESVTAQQVSGHSCFYRPSFRIARFLTPGHAQSFQPNLGAAQIQITYNLSARADGDYKFRAWRTAAGNVVGERMDVGDELSHVLRCGVG